MTDYGFTTNPEDNYRYAMHFGWIGGVPDAEFLDGLREVVGNSGIEGIDVYCNEDQFQTWGERLSTYEEEIFEILAGADVKQSIASCSGHFMLYVPKGIHPRVIWEAIEGFVCTDTPVMTVALIDGLWSRTGEDAFRDEDGRAYPFTIDEAQVWGENIEDAWKTGVRNSNGGW